MGLSTHVLDTMHGGPAAAWGRALHHRRRSRHAGEAIHAEFGRPQRRAALRQQLAEGRHLPPGFPHVAGYLKGPGRQVPGPNFPNKVSLDFGVAPPPPALPRAAAREPVELLHLPRLLSRASVALLLAFGQGVELEASALVPQPVSVQVTEPRRVAGGKGDAFSTVRSISAITSGACLGARSQCIERTLPPASMFTSSVPHRIQHRRQLSLVDARAVGVVDMARGIAAIGARGRSAGRGRHRPGPDIGAGPAQLAGNRPGGTAPPSHRAETTEAASARRRGVSWRFMAGFFKPESSRARQPKVSMTMSGAVDQLLAPPAPRRRGAGARRVHAGLGAARGRNLDGRVGRRPHRHHRRRAAGVPGDQGSARAAGPGRASLSTASSAIHLGPAWGSAAAGDVPLLRAHHRRRCAEAAAGSGRAARARGPLRRRARGRGARPAAFDAAVLGALDRQPRRRLPPTNSPCRSTPSTPSRHAEDLDIVIACLKRLRERNDLPYVGLIGSKTKWATFSHRLEARGFTADELARITCPIGVPGHHGQGAGGHRRGGGGTVVAIAG
ncbi:xdhC rossmann domain-containing protein [Ditylenchus destructor]|uniref:XdhC rossmann domain-containing protein n=1 Tax=Ditylenchus destructor TaxID=166010 RepID=A0AAD4QWE3_9BILA|nr:xdhC rossmann domain-containing protein [Ditylenchus destructor]